MAGQLPVQRLRLRGGCVDTSSLGPKLLRETLKAERCDSLVCMTQHRRQRVGVLELVAGEGPGAIRLERP